MSGATSVQAEMDPTPGLRKNWKQFALLGVLVVFTGSMVGFERSLGTLLAKEVFGIASAVAALSFLVAFGLAKAVTNLGGGHLADRFGRRRILLLGWAIGIPVPLIVIFADSWSVVVFANALLGVNQGLAWSMALNMKIDLAGPRKRGLAAGVNESLGYGGVAAVTFLAALLASKYGIRPIPLLVTAGIASAGLLLAFATRETRAPSGPSVSLPDLVPALKRGLFLDPALASASAGGFATNLKEGLVWGLLPLLLASRGASLPEIGAVSALSALAWAIVQLVAGPLSDVVGRRALIVTGFLVQAGGLVLLASSATIPAALAAGVVTGIGTGLVYPTLIAYVSDAALPRERATSLGVYRFVRDLGYVGGALVGGFVADFVGIQEAFLAGAIVVVLAAAFVAAARPSARRVPLSSVVEAEES